jgi:integrase
VTNEELLTRFEREHMDRNSITPERRVAQLKVLRRYGSHLNGRLLVDAEAGDVLSFLGSEIAERGVCPNTGRKHHGMIRAFNSWAFSVGLIDPVQIAALRAVPNPRGSSAQTRPKPYKPAEIREFYVDLAKRYPYLPAHGRHSLLLRRYYKGMSPFTRQIWRHARRLQFEAQVSLALEEGLRRIEIFRTTIPQMHYDNEGVVVFTAKGEPGQVREREVPFTAHSRARVQDWLDFRSTLSLSHDRPWLRLAPNGGDHFAPLTLEQMSGALDVFDHHWSWHRFRHTFATERLRAGLPLEQLQYMLGHGNLDQTLAYAKIIRSDIQKGAERTEQAFAESLGLVA